MFVYVRHILLPMFGRPQAGLVTVVGAHKDQLIYVQWYIQVKQCVTCG